MFISCPCQISNFHFFYRRQHSFVQVYAEVSGKISVLVVFTILENYV